MYGTLCAIPLLAWALTGDSSQVSAVKPLIRPGKVEGFVRCSLHGRDYPAAIKSEAKDSELHGYLVTFRRASERRKLDDFEGDAYEAAPVVVRVLSESGKPSGEVVAADMYVWNGSLDELSHEPWDFDAFVRERLEDWLDLFSGMELVGEN